MNFEAPAKHATLPRMLTGSSYGFEVPFKLYRM